MDALKGCYGSEDSSDSDVTDPSSQQPPFASLKETKKKQDINVKEKEKKSDSLTGLLVAYSDEEDKDEKDVGANNTTTTADTNANNKTNLHSSIQSRNSENNSIIQKSEKEGSDLKKTTRRRKRRWDNAEGYDAEEIDERLAHYSLPPPRLSSSLSGEGADTPFDALILFPKDYVTPFTRKHVAMTSRQNRTTERPGLAKKLDNMYKKFYENDGEVINPNSKSNDNVSTTVERNSFGSHLKNQKEFGNPNLFPTIIQHFGIDPMGSNLPSGLWDPKNDFEPFEYVERLVSREEENRIRSMRQKQQD